MGRGLKTRPQHERRVRINYLRKLVEGLHDVPVRFAFNFKSENFTKVLRKTTQSYNIRVAARPALELEQCLALWRCVKPSSSVNTQLGRDINNDRHDIGLV